MFEIIKYLTMATVLSSSALFGASFSTATSITYDLDVEYSGATPSSGVPKATLSTIDDGITDSTVLLTMDLTNLTPVEFAAQWNFNFDPDKNASLLSFNYVSGVQAVSTTGLNNAYSADGDAFYDINFAFDTSENGTRFDAGLLSVYTISYSGGGITWADFNFLDSDSNQNKGDFYTAAHVQGIGEGGLESGWMGHGTPVPEPGTYLLLGSTLALVACAQRRKAAQVS